jgi:hypothetical protein
MGCLAGLTSLSASVSAQDVAPEPGVAQETGVQVFLPGFYAQYRPETAFGIIHNTPGFQLDTGDGGRGLAGSQGNILINGQRPPPRGSSIQTRLSAIRAEDVQRVELIDAGARDVDMQGYPVLLNLVITAQTSRRVDGTLSLSNSEDGGESTSIDLRSNINGENHESQISLEASSNLNHEFGRFLSSTSDLPEPRLSDDSRSNMQFHTLTGTSSVSLGERSTLNLSATNHGMDFRSRPEADVAVSGIQLLNGSTVTANSASADLRSELRDDLDLTIVLAASQNESENTSSLREAGVSSYFASLSQSGENAARATLRWNMTDTLVIEGGATWAFNYLEGSSLFTVDGVEVDIDGSVARVEEVRTAGLGSVTWTPDARLSATLGGRIERFQLQSTNAAGQEFELTDIIPRANVSYSFDNDWVVRLRSEREVAQLGLGRFLATTNLTTAINTAGAQLLEPERNWTHELTVERRFDERGLFRMQAREIQADNPISNVPDGAGIIRPINISPETIREIQGELDIPLDRFGVPGAVLEFDALVRESDRLDPLTGRNRPVSRLPAHTWEITLRHEIENTDIIWGFELSDDAPKIDYWLTQIREREERIEVDLFVEWRPRTDLRGGLRFELAERVVDDRRIYDGVRTASNQPVLFNSLSREQDPSVRAWVEWEAREAVKLNLSLNSGRSRSAFSRVADGAGIELYDAQRADDRVPSVHFSLRFNR